jgi:restriction system protein
VEIRKHLAGEFSLSQEELDARLPSGRAKMFANRVGWAITYLYRTKLLARPRRSVYRITPRGQAVLAENPHWIDLQVLAQFEELREFKARSHEDRSDHAAEMVAAPEDSNQTPEEQIESAYRVLRAALAADLMERVKEQSPAFLSSSSWMCCGYGGTAARTRTPASTSARAVTKA